SFLYFFLFSELKPSSRRLTLFFPPGCDKQDLLLLPGFFSAFLDSKYFLPAFLFPGRLISHQIFSEPPYLAVHRFPDSIMLWHYPYLSFHSHPSAQRAYTVLINAWNSLQLCGFLKLVLLFHPVSEKNLPLTV